MPVLDEYEEYWDRTFLELPTTLKDPDKPAPPHGLALSPGAVVDTSGNACP